MRVKIAGIGKCGVRIAYDFFAYTENEKSSYEIRLGTHGKFLDRPVQLVKAYLEPFKSSLSSLLSERFYRIVENPRYTAIDSDSANNEIINNSPGEDERVRFPGSSFNLSNHEGGCNFHIVSESIARRWKAIPNDITSSKDIDIYVTSFSIAGGTGGGSAPIICQASEKGGRSDHLCHKMGLGILPKSDQSYLEDENLLSMSDVEKFSTGRFLLSIYANRIPNGMNSLWLFSNDALIFLLRQDIEREEMAGKGGEMNLNISLVNYMAAQSLTVLANSSSKLTSAETNLDPRELNDNLSRLPFVSGVASRRVESLDLGSQVLSVKNLLANALENPHIQQDGRLEGLSVPISSTALIPLHKIVDDSSADYDHFRESLRSYNPDEGPIEFWTTHRLIVLYGQPEKKSSQIKQNMITHACEAIFPNSQKLHFWFRHHGDRETLLLLLTDPFIPFVVSSIYYYANNAWSRSGDNFANRFDSLIESVPFKEPDFLDAEKEIYSSNMYGDGAGDVQTRVESDPSLAVTREHVISAFRHLHEIFHRRRASLNTSLQSRRRKPSSDDAQN